MHAQVPNHRDQSAHHTLYYTNCILKYNFDEIFRYSIVSVTFRLYCVCIKKTIAELDTRCRIGLKPIFLVRYLHCNKYIIYHYHSVNI